MPASSTLTAARAATPSGAFTMPETAPYAGPGDFTDPAAFNPYLASVRWPSVSGALWGVMNPLLAPSPRPLAASSLGAPPWTWPARRNPYLVRRV